MKNVKVIIWGMGAMGSGMAKMLMKKTGVDVVGAIDIGQKVGKPIFDVLGEEFPNNENIKISTAEEVIKEKAADIVLICTDSFTAKAFDKIKKVVENKINVITSAEEMAFPKAQNPELAEKLDQLAKENGVSILGTGINPGLIMDVLVLVMTGACEDIHHITSRRVNSLSPFGKAVMEEQGIGISVAEFEQGKADGSLAGHVGFPESISMIAEALGVKLDAINQSMDAIVTDVDRKAPYGEAKAGSVAGVSMKASGIKDGKELIEMDHPQQIEPEQVGVKTGDYVIIDGNPQVNLVNSPEIEGGVGTIAMCVNMIPQTINARPGLVSMIDLPIPHAILGDFRDQIHEEAKIV
ncbi:MULTISPECIES: 2,4-diaminopentanoate dehydrogenase [Enterococcus]|uniref:Gfo/Idh/MocA family oxidoreductase n=1 Tax=Candidatus Enterococcus murrayae TaxID=2815321 RepID=A0ABS3HLT1_9ENTE|nr:2,4-diaminopentanoate dehydrogenase [Enterococcus sp. MJM16]MBO0454402.1 Gfo/Idh/MocA family oxidoreductase [Enterococcus sp. MJM16]